MRVEPVGSALGGKPCEGVLLWLLDLGDAQQQCSQASRIHSTSQPQVADTVSASAKLGWAQPPSFQNSLESSPIRILDVSYPPTLRGVR